MIQVKNVAGVTLLCLALFLGTEARELFAPRQVKSANQATYCSYDGQVYFSNTVQAFTQTNVWSCRDSYAYSYSSRYIVVTLSNIQVNCNGFDDIELWDNTGKEWIYCRDGRPSSYTFVADGARWLGISRLGRVSFSSIITFTNQNPGVVVTNPPVTNSPVTNSPVTNGPSTGSCGVQTIKPDETGLRIVGGQVVVPNSWPWQAGFKTRGSFFCGGSLINDQWILTAAHCKTSVTGLAVHLGDHNIVTDNSGETRVGATKWINHPQYDNVRLDNDIALVKLDRKVTFTSSISPVCLPNGKSPVIGTTGVVTGWGLTQADGGGDISTLLRQAVIPINNDSVCGYGTLPRTQICAGIRSTANPRDSCQGDSGGPFVLKDRSTNSYYVAGIVSYGNECGGRGAYTNVKEFETWIAQTIAAN